MNDASSSVSCTLSPEELRARREQLLPGLMKRVESITDIPDGLRLRFPYREGLLAELTAIIEQEQICCSFLCFVIVVEPSADPIVLEVSGPPGTREMLRAL